MSVLDVEGCRFCSIPTPKPDYALIQLPYPMRLFLALPKPQKARPQQGMVISQVRWITKSGAINPRDVDVPGPLVNYVVVSPKEYHWQSGTIEYGPRIHTSNATFNDSEAVRMFPA